MDIFIIVDSHTLAYSNIDPSIKVIPFISRTLYRVGLEDINEIRYKDLGIGEGSYVVNIFGEIDAQFHIG